MAAPAAYLLGETARHAAEQQAQHERLRAAQLQRSREARKQAAAAACRRTMSAAQTRHGQSRLQMSVVTVTIAAVPSPQGHGIAGPALLAGCAHART